MEKPVTSLYLKSSMHKHISSRHNNAEIKHSDWTLQVTWIVLANQGALFQSRVVNSMRILFYDIGFRMQSIITILYFCSSKDQAFWLVKIFALLETALACLLECFNISSRWNYLLHQALSSQFTLSSVHWSVM